MSGAAHHTCMSSQVGLEAWTDFARMAQTELLVIDENTNIRQYADEIRWNQSYYRLAQGF
jgi:L-arabinose isomerase